MQLGRRRESKSIAKISIHRNEDGVMLSLLQNLCLKKKGQER